MTFCAGRFLTPILYQQRRMLAEQAKKNAREAERACGGIVGECSCQLQCTVQGKTSVCADGDSDSEWDGISLKSPKGKRRANEEEEEAFEDEEQLATVTVVEEFDPDSLIHGTQPAPKPHEDGDDSAERPRDSQPRAKTKPAGRDAKTKVKTATRAKDIKYQTGAARKAEREKQRKRKLEKAERAGGKAPRRKGSSRGKR